MTAKGVSAPFRELRDRPSQRCLSCLSDTVRRSSLGLKVALVLLHVVFVGAVFLLDGDLIEKTKTEPWSAREFTEGFDVLSVLDIHACSTSKIPSYVYFSFLIWRLLCWWLFSLATLNYRALTCSYCSLEQPPRSKHCQECDKCVLRFDHHCVWLGTCIGQNNHCRFWWKDVIMILLLCGLLIILVFLLLLLFFHSYLVLTNQTTYELVRWRHITYLRGIPERVYPFSKGIRQNLYRFCCARGSDYDMERVPTQSEFEELARPYTCLDILTCRCC